MMKMKNNTSDVAFALSEGLCISNLKVMRKKYGYSLQQLGDMCGKSKAHMWELEKAGSNPTLKTAYAISKVFGVDVTEIWPNMVEIVEETIIVRRVCTTQKQPSRNATTYNRRSTN